LKDIIMDKVKLIYAVQQNGQEFVCHVTDLNFNLKEWAKTRKESFKKLGVIKTYEIIMDVRTNADFNFSAKKE